jgi:hypothetical protein
MRLPDDTSMRRADTTYALTGIHQEQTYKLTHAYIDQYVSSLLSVCIQTRLQTTCCLSRPWPGTETALEYSFLFEYHAKYSQAVLQIFPHSGGYAIFCLSRSMKVKLYALTEPIQRRDPNDPSGLLLYRRISILDRPRRGATRLGIALPIPRCAHIGLRSEHETRTR